MFSMFARNCSTRGLFPLLARWLNEKSSDGMIETTMKKSMYEMLEIDKLPEAVVDLCRGVLKRDKMEEIGGSSWKR